MNADHRGTAKGREHAARIYTMLLRLYPHAHRQRFGEQMLQTFRDQYHETVEQERQAHTRFWLEVVADEGKSIAREHVAALGERRPSMRNLVVFGWKPLTIVAALALFVALANTVRSGDVGLFMLLAIPVYVALLFLVAGFARGFSQPQRRRSWWRLGLALGGVLGLYVSALNALYAFAPMPLGQTPYGANPRPIWLIALPVLAGVVGVLGSYGTGRMRTGIVAGILAAGIAVCLNVVSAVLLVTVLWHTLQEGQLHSYLQADTTTWIRTQWAVQHPGLAPDLTTYLTNVHDDASAAFGLVSMNLFLIVIWPVPLMVGSALGALVTRQAANARRRATAASAAASAPARPVRRNAHHVAFVALVVALGVLLWSSYAGYTILQSVSAGSIPTTTVGEVAASYGTSAFLAWVLAFLIVVAASYVVVRPTSEPQAMHVTGG